MVKKIKPLSITASSLVTAAGCGKQIVLDAIQNNKTALRNISYPGLNFNTWLGKINDIDNVELESSLQSYNCRNNKLAKLGLDTDNFRHEINSAIKKYDKNRIGVFMGTSTSGKAETEAAYTQLDQNNVRLPADFDMLHTHNIASVQDYVQHSLGLDGVGLTISTACSSSAKVFATAHRYIDAGLCDAAIVGGVDSLCLSTIYGFHSLQLVSSKPCCPWDAERNGISIGEAAGFVLLERSDEAKNKIQLKGFGESSDAYHMSTPHPDGEGAAIAMKAALVRSGLSHTEIDYINLHGTATPSNDLAESQALQKVFSTDITCSSTKGLTGHTLGAAGITEAIICSLVLENNTLPGTVNFKNTDLSLTVKVLETSVVRSVNNVMSNSFGFGGSNCSLVFGW